jgi:hypothetical protein
MGRQPRSGDIPWLAAHSILNWIGGDISMLILFRAKSRTIMQNSAGLVGGRTFIEDNVNHLFLYVCSELDPNSHRQPFRRSWRKASAQLALQMLYLS